MVCDLFRPWLPTMGTFLGCVGVGTCEICLKDEEVCAMALSRLADGGAAVGLEIAGERALTDSLRRVSRRLSLGSEGAGLSLGVEGALPILQSGVPYSVLSGAVSRRGIMECWTC